MKKTLAIATALFLSGCSDAVVQEISFPEEPVVRLTAAEASSPFDTKWPSNLTREVLVQTALDKAKEFFKQGGETDQKSVYIDEAVGQSNVEWIEDLSAQSISAFDEYLTDDFALVVGLQGDYLNKTI